MLCKPHYFPARPTLTTAFSHSITYIIANNRICRSIKFVCAFPLRGLNNRTRNRFVHLPHTSSKYIFYKHTRTYRYLNEYWKLSTSVGGGGGGGLWPSSSSQWEMIKNNLPLFDNWKYQSNKVKQLMVPYCFV